MALVYRNGKVMRSKLPSNLSKDDIRFLESLKAPKNTIRRALALNVKIVDGNSRRKTKSRKI